MGIEKLIKRLMSISIHVSRFTIHGFSEALHPFRKKYHRDFWAVLDIDL
jgi:hypothetical protein